MHAKRRQRLLFILSSLVVMAVVAGMVLYALKQNINLYFTPSQVKPEHVRLHEFRLGGMVVQQSVKHGEDLNMDFVVTDFNQTISVHYRGILPALFREGQGVVVEGHLEKSGRFMAHRVLAKHDENYMPPNIKVSHDT